MNKVFSRSLTFAALLMLGVQTFAQITFQKAYGGVSHENNECFNRSTGVINSTSDEGYVICHSTLSFGKQFSQGVYFFKLNKLGDTIFTRTFYRNDGACFGRSVYQTPDGGYILGVGLNTNGLALIRTNSQGNILWSKKIGNTHTGYYGLPLSDGCFLATGAHVQAVLSKVDANGNLVFGKRYYITDTNSYAKPVLFYSSAECSNGDLLSTGFTTSLNVTGIIVVRTNSVGTVKFSKKYSLPGYFAGGYHIIELKDKSIAVVGFSEQNTNSDYNIFLLRTDSTGNLIFFRSFGDGTYQWSNSIVSDASDNLYFTGVTTTSLSTQIAHAMTIKTDNMGNIIWCKRYENAEYGNGIVLTKDKGIAIAGIGSKITSGDEDIFVLKCDSTGGGTCDTYDHSIANMTVAVTTSSVPLITKSDITAANFTFAVNKGTIITTKCAKFDTSGTITQVQKNQAVISNVNLFPNPTSQFCKIVSEVRFGSGSIEITDLAGRRMRFLMSQDIEKENIDVGELNKGIYQVNIHAGGTKTILKLVKN